MELLYFILGILFVQYIIPVIEGFISWLLIWIEAKKAKQSEIINQTNINMHQASASADRSPLKHKIGFCAPDAEDYVEEEDEDDF